MDGEGNPVTLGWVTTPRNCPRADRGELLKGRFELRSTTPVGFASPRATGTIYCGRLLTSAASCGGAPLDLIQPYLEQPSDTAIVGGLPRPEFQGLRHSLVKSRARRGVLYFSILHSPDSACEPVRALTYSVNPAFPVAVSLPSCW